MTRLSRAALAYATKLRWPVHPLAPRRKEPISAHGFHDATIDVDQIRTWWARCPDANIGIACNEHSGLLAVDVDPRNGGHETMEDLNAMHGPLPHTVESQTGGGGRHVLFNRPPGVRFRARVGAGVDIKAGGYIVAPPSVHECGRAYVWELTSRPGEVALADLPNWMLALVVDFTPKRGLALSAEPAEASFLARAFMYAGLLIRPIDGGRVAVRCPWAREHTTRGSASSSVVFAASSADDAGWFHCSHTSHGPKSLRDVLSALPPDAVRRAAVETLYATAGVATESGR